MDGYDGYVTTLDVFEESPEPYVPPNPTNFIIPETVTVFVMRAQDLNCLPTLTYRTWVVYNKPDFEMAKYHGSYCGASKNFSNIVVVNQIKLV